MSFVWFWTFWHWSKEGVRCGSLLRGPLHGIAGHWDEWFLHEASPEDRRAIEEAGRTRGAQRQFIAWLFRHWAREANLGPSRLVPRFVAGQLAALPPFDRWAAFEGYRAGYGVGGIAAVVLAEKSLGEPGDVRPVEALALPADGNGAEPAIVPEGFRAGGAELDLARRAALSLLHGKGLLVFLSLWIAGGRRPYPRWLGALLGLGWIAVAGAILALRFGPEPNERLFALAFTLAALWSALVLTAATTSLWQCMAAWWGGRGWWARLERSQVRLRMNGGLMLQGGSAGLPFALNTLLGLHRAHPGAARSSWLWRSCFRGLRSKCGSWAATGVITEEGPLKPVVLEPKLRACLQHPAISHLLAPRQPRASRRAIDRIAASLAPERRPCAPAALLGAGARLGFAAEARRLRAHRSRHLAGAMLLLGDLWSGRQLALGALALLASAVLLAAAPDLRGLLLPPPAPAAVAPSSTSPYHLWVSLDTRHPDSFYVMLESEYWANRRARVEEHSENNASMRAEIRLHRLARPLSQNEEDGTVWIERRNQFLTREFAPGERVGRFSLSYLSRLGHE